MKNNTILKPGDIVYVKLADTTFIGTLQHLTKKNKWQVLAYPILNTAKDRDVKAWRNMGYLKTILKVDAQYITKYDVAVLYPASVTIIDTDSVTQAFCVYSQIHDGNIGIFPIFPNVPGARHRWYPTIHNLSNFVKSTYISSPFIDCNTSPSASNRYVHE